MTSPSAKGRRLEWDVRIQLGEKGWCDLERSPLSRGPWDVRATDLKGLPVYIQCKRCGRGKTPAVGPKEWNALLLCAEQAGGYALIAGREPNKPIRYWKVLRPKKPGGYKQPWKEVAL